MVTNLTKKENSPKQVLQLGFRSLYTYFFGGASGVLYCENKLAKALVKWVFLIL